MALKRSISAALALMASACGGAASKDEMPDRANLEAAARARGLIHDAAEAPLTGLFSRDRDRICVIAEDGAGIIGVSSDYGDGIGCTAIGTVRGAGALLAVTLGDGDCRFNADYDGKRIAFPAVLPSACARFCTSRASLTALSVERVSDSGAEAAALHDARGKPLCDD